MMETTIFTTSVVILACINSITSNVTILWYVWVDTRRTPVPFSTMVRAGTAEGKGLVGPRPHHFFAPSPPLFALKRKIIKIKKRLETSFFPSIFRYILCIFFNFKRQAFCGAPVLFAVIVPWGRLAPWSNAMPWQLPWPHLRFVRQRVL